MSKLSERKVLHNLGLKDWRGLRKEHYLQLVNMLPQMDVQVCKEAWIYQYQYYPVHGRS